MSKRNNDGVQKMCSALLALLLVLLPVLSGCSASNEDLPTDSDTTISNPATGEALIPPPAPPSASTQRPTRPATTQITLADNAIVVNGSGASVNGNTLTISEDGVYEITGTLSDGQILIDAPDSAVVELVLSGIHVSNSKNAAIYCKNCDDLFISLTENTRNIISDARDYIYDDTVKEEPNAALFSKTDLNIGGTGWLTVNANFKHGIYTKDDLVIEGGGFRVNAVADAIKGKDSITVLNGRFEITSGGDAFQASNADGAAFGYVQITNGDFVIRSVGDAIQAETSLVISDGRFDITTDGTPAGRSNSQKGLKAGTLLTVENGSFRIISKDDAVHSDVDVKIGGGTFYIETKDDGIHADRNLYINGGEIEIPVCYEGFEGTVIEINGGKSYIKASNDALSAAAGTPEAEAFEGRGGNPYVQAWIRGGELEASAGGDVVDSNGNIYVTGGTLRLSAPPYPDYEGSLLCNGDVTISGGNIAAVGCMGVNVYWDKQPILWFSHTNEIVAGSTLSIRDADGNVLLELATRSDAVQSVYTTPDFKVGETYSLYIDGEKKLDVTLKDGMNAIGDDGGRFTGGYGRGNMASFRN